MSFFAIEYILNILSSGGLMMRSFFYWLKRLFGKKVPDSQDNSTRTELEEKGIELLDTLDKSTAEVEELYSKLACAEDVSSYESEVKEHISTYENLAKNLSKAYKKVLFTNDELYARWREISRSRKHKRFRLVPANSEIDLFESRADHFARGINMHKLIWICFIGSFTGVIIEMLWTLLYDGVIQSRAGLIFGPFNLLYGIGAVALTLALHRFRNRGRWLSFLGGMITGNAVEYACSFMQELVFGSRSWDYSSQPFNLNGRICLLYGVYWGILGVFWVKSLYPWAAKMILKIPNKVGKVISYIIVAFFAVNAIITVLAILRWSQRISGTASAGGFASLMDALFPDSFMQIIFPNMKFS